MLATIKIKKEWHSKDIVMIEPRLQLVKKFYINQIKSKHGVYHFGTSGTIFGLGYGPKFHQNKHVHSIDRYSNRKSVFFSEFT